MATFWCNNSYYLPVFVCTFTKNHLIWHSHPSLTVTVFFYYHLNSISLYCLRTYPKIVLLIIWFYLWQIIRCTTFASTCSLHIYPGFASSPSIFSPVSCDKKYKIQSFIVTKLDCMSNIYSALSWVQTKIRAKSTKWIQMFNNFWVPMFFLDLVDISIVSFTINWKVGKLHSNGNSIFAPFSLGTSER